MEGWLSMQASHSPRTRCLGVSRYAHTATAHKQTALHQFYPINHHFRHNLAPANYGNTVGQFNGNNSFVKHCRKSGFRAFFCFVSRIVVPSWDVWSLTGYGVAGPCRSTVRYTISRLTKTKLETRSGLNFWFLASIHSRLVLNYWQISVPLNYTF